MKKHTVLIILFLTLYGCGLSKATSDKADKIQSSSSDYSKQSDGYKMLTEYFIKGDSLSYNGYDIVELKKTVKDENTGDLFTEVTYPVIRKDGKVLATFQGPYFSLGNATGFGLFPLLGDAHKQLVISQTVPRGGRHWAVNLSPSLRVIFDSQEYGLGREEFSVRDFDNDGIYEISLALTRFWGFDGMSMAESPLPEIIFKYEGREQRFLPANPLFQEHLLSGLQTGSKKQEPCEGPSCYSSSLGILLKYIYVGREEEGWAIFDREYNQPDKEERKLRIKAVLEKEPIYKFLYRRTAT